MSASLAAARRHDWRIVAPWYRWERADGLEPERAASAVRPVFQKYVSTDFVADYLRDPQRSVVFDDDIDVYQTVKAIPSAELVADDGRLRSLSRSRLVPSDTRKLFLPAHQRFYLVAVGIHCDRPGFPKVDPDSISEVGFVVRRHRVEVPSDERARGAALLAELTQSRAVAGSRLELDAAKARSRILHPFKANSRDRVVSPRAATVAAHQQLELARRRLRVWADQVGVAHRTEAWITTGEGAFGEWVATADEPEELIERSYRMRLLTPPPDEPHHAAHDGTIYFASVPTASDEITADGTSRFNELDTYEVRVFARVDCGDCPGPLVWSNPTQVFRLASFYDPMGSAQRPVEVRLPDFAELEATAAMPSVRMSAPAGSSLEFSKFGEIPTKGKVGVGKEICFFSIPLITIIALFVLNLFLPIVIFVFQLWWMLKLKFCIPPSIEFEGELAAELNVEPPELEATAELDIDVLTGVDQDALAAVLAEIFDPAADPALDPVPAAWRLGSRVIAGFTNDPLAKLAVRRGYGSSADGAPTFTAPITVTTAVRRDQVVHP
ncbi:MULTISPECIES: hypothetical protein [Rhodococcus]|uniref:hypothetical protein n=1 Tax=Rhodococcus TaxID=1827 RepID=UPI00135CA10C|nr:MULTISPECIES: hypothetical protein [Rhodococcus]KAF0956732.1 hypothetical protein MLGJGCBP_10140 [Rhodococcus sp. T7]KAF0966605.1 hypothetical protein MLGJGCBP_00230 [Rhodococcus sp. T7]UOT08368.1 hypothetical protein MPY17_39440 [Rhodococcus opacus]